MSVILNTHHTFSQFQCSSMLHAFMHWELCSAIDVGPVGGRINVTEQLSLPAKGGAQTP